MIPFLKKYWKLLIVLFWILMALVYIFLIQNTTPKEYKEQLSVDASDYSEDDSEVDTMNSVDNNASFKNIPTIAKDIIMNGMDDIRLITIHKKHTSNGTSYYKRYSYDDDGNAYEQSYIPGIDVLFGYNLINLAHYHLKTQRKSLFFQKPVLIKTLYYPTLNKDSIDNKPVRREYFLVTVYDEDSNKDTLINKKDLRHIYHFDAENTQKTLLIPREYSVYKSTFDLRNDAMYIHAKYDENKNGSIDDTENAHVFMINLKDPIDIKRIY